MDAQELIQTKKDNSAFPCPLTEITPPKYYTLFVEN